MKLTTKLAEEIVGGLSKPSKMPGFAYSIPAKECNVGGKMHKVEGSTCEKCYALKGRYMFPNVQKALYRRLQAIDDPQWVDAMAFLINKRSAKHPFFRWHDSGDIQSVSHLEKIVEVCNKTPQVKHWIPTREYVKVGNREPIVQSFLDKGGVIPDNLTVRLSALMNNGPAPTAIAKKIGVQTSTVSTAGFSCPASLQGNVCGDCRACWDKSVENITYKKH